MSVQRTLNPSQAGSFGLGKSDRGGNRYSRQAANVLPVAGKTRARIGGHVEGVGRNRLRRSVTQSILGIEGDGQLFPKIIVGDAEATADHTTLFGAII